MSSPPSVTLPGDPGLPSLSPLYVNGIPLAALNTGLALNGAQAVLQKPTSEQHFFSTPPRPNGDSTRDVFQVSLSSAQRVNQFSFCLAHFPQRAWAQYMDPVTGSWTTFTQENGLPVVVSVQDSVPAVIASGVSDSSHLHPQHFGAGHWTPFTFQVSPVSVSRIRIVMTRITAESVPLSPLGDTVSYSLGVKDFGVGYATLTYGHVPLVRTSDSVFTESVPIAVGQDLLGSALQYVVRRNRASDLLNHNGAIWKCQPQPIADAVVSLFLDVRSSDGSPQVMDRFFMDPLYSGCTVNLYSSLDTPFPDVFTASDQPLAFPLTQSFGAQAPVADDGGIVFPATTAFLDIDNSVVSFDPTQPFQISAAIQPQFPSTDTGSYTFYDDGVLRFFWGPDPTGATASSVVQISLGSMLLSWPGLVFDFNQELVLTTTYDGVNLTLDSPMGTITAVSGNLFPGTVPPPVLRIGGSLTTDPSAAQPGNFRLRALIFKQGNPDTVDTYSQFWSDPTAFVVTPEYPVGAQTSDNAVLRYDPAQQTDGFQSLNPYGFVGGPGVVYEDLSWTPVPRDFKLVKGYFTFDPVKARYFKLEFTNLSAQPYETASPVVNSFKTFTGSGTTSTTPAQAAATSSPAQSSGIDVNTQVSSLNRFSDQNRLTASGTNATTPTTTATYLPTEAQYVTDPQGAVRMAAAAPYWNFSKQHSSPTMPRNQLRGVHFYQTSSIPFKQRVAYFVGLKSLKAFRASKQAQDDTDQYTELFHDAHDLVYDPTRPTWTLGDGVVSTGTPLVAPVQLLSQPYNSFRSVSALQFATTQSPAKQLLTDPDFNDFSLQFWEPMGDAAITPAPDFDTQIGSLVKVTRAGNPVTWSSMEISYPTWNDLEDSDPNPYRPTWDALEGTILSSASGGIQSFQSVQPSSLGRLYAAARVIAPADLSAPLVLQLVNGDGTVLATAPKQVLANQITEWFVEYDLGAGATPAGVATWSAVEATGTWSQVEALGLWDQVSGITVDLTISNVSVQLVQQQATADVWYIDNLSIFNDAIMWEFSRDGGQTFWPVWDIRNDPHGVFVFPTGADAAVVGQGSSLVWRLTGALADLSVSSIAVRPWFDSIMYGQQVKYSVQAGGPNLSPLDQYPLVTDDPRFKTWHNPIPQDWWYAYRQALRAGALTPTITQRSFLPDTVPVGVDEGAPPAAARSITPSAIVYH